MSPVIEWLQQSGGLSAEQLAWILAGAAFLENIFPPLPMDVVVAYGGYLAGQERLPFWLAWLTTLTGGWVGFMGVYFVGRNIAKTQLHQRLLTGRIGDGLTKAEAWFQRFGYGAVVGNRFLAGTRAVISLFAGLAGLSWSWVALGALGSLAIWNTLLLVAGYKLGQDWALVAEWLTTYRNVMMGALLVGILVWWKIRQW